MKPILAQAEQAHGLGMRRLGLGRHRRAEALLQVGNSRSGRRRAPTGSRGFTGPSGRTWAGMKLISQPRRSSLSLPGEQCTGGVVQRQFAGRQRHGDAALAVEAVADSWPRLIMLWASGLSSMRQHRRRCGSRARRGCNRPFSGTPTAPPRRSRAPTGSREEMAPSGASRT